MAHAGQNEGDDIWEDASDIFEIRSEVGSSGTLTPDELGNDDSESSQPEDVNPQRANRLERPPARLMNPAMERESVRDRTHAQRGAESRTPPSDYQLAPMVFNSSSKRSKSSHQSPSPVRERPNGPSKHREVKSVMKPPRFDGKDGCIESHLVQFEIVAKRNDWDDNEKVDFLKCTLIGEASHMLRDLSDSATYDDVVYKLRQRYGSIEQIERFRMELKQRRRKPGESLSILLKDVRRLFSQAYTGPHNYLSELMAVDAFVEALNDRELKIKVLEREPSSLDQAYKIAERMELYQNIPDEKVAESRPKQTVKVRATAAEDESMLKSVVETQRLMQKQLALLTESVNKDRTPARRSGDSNKQSSVKLKGPCHHCGKPGHYRAECPELAPKPHGTKGTSYDDPTRRSIEPACRSCIDRTIARSSHRTRIGKNRTVGRK